MVNKRVLSALVAAGFASSMAMSSACQSVSACTDFLLQTTDRSSIVGRSMEWGLDLESQIWQYNRGQERHSTAPNGKTGVSWHSKYGYLGLDAHDMPLALDGLNEKGLSMGQLWLPGTVYQKVSADHPEEALSVVDLGHWILGNFATVDEVKAAIGGVKIWAPEMADWGGIPTCHLALHDASGKSAVIEFVGGEQKIYDNLGHVLTNAPTFDWHLTNLRNYIKVSSANASPITVGDSVLAPPGQGGGFLGIPGDWTPPSRFVRTSAMLNFAKPANNAAEGITLAQHLLNAVDIPLGDVRTASNDLNHSDYTQWIVVKDLSNKVLYFRSYYNQALCQIDMTKLDFGSDSASHKLMAVSGGISSLDMTDVLLNKNQAPVEKPGKTAR